MFVIAHAQGQKNQSAEQRQNKQQRRIVVQHMNGTAEDLPSQQDQAQQGDAGVPRSQGPGTPSIAHPQNRNKWAQVRLLSGAVGNGV